MSGTEPDGGGPGWRWSSDIAPIAGTASCQSRHLGYVISGAMQIRMDDGSELTVSAGDLFDLPPGHDAWVLGEEPCVMVDTSPDATRYARSGATQPADSTRVSRGTILFTFLGDRATDLLVMHEDLPGDDAFFA